MANEVLALVNRIVAASGDASPTDALDRYNTAHQRMVARARSFRKTVSMGTTTAGTDTYAAPSGLIELLELDVAGYPYSRARHVDRALSAQSYLTLSGPGGIFVEQHDSAGALQVSLYPVPGTTGDAISGYGVFAAPTQATTDTPIVDADFWDDLVDYALALGRERDDERQDAGAVFRQHFDAACEEFRLRVAKRMRGTAPMQARIVGVTA